MSRDANTACLYYLALYSAIMAQCKAFGCYNNKRANPKKHYFMIPTPSNPERTDLARQWLHNIGTGRSVDKFTFGRNSFVCEDHFEKTCYKRNLQAELLGEPCGRIRLTETAVPTIFVHRPSKTEKNKDSNREIRQETRSKRKVRDVYQYLLRIHELR